MIPPWLISAVIGALFALCGMSLFVDSTGWRAWVGFALVALGLLTPIFPWWVPIVLYMG